MTLWDYLTLISIKWSAFKNDIELFCGKKYFLLNNYDFIMWLLILVMIVKFYSLDDVSSIFQLDAPFIVLWSSSFQRLPAVPESPLGDFQRQRPSLSGFPAQELAPVRLSLDWHWPFWGFAPCLATFGILVHFHTSRPGIYPQGLSLRVPPPPLRVLGIVQEWPI